MCFIGMIHIGISNPGSLRSKRIKGTNESTLRKDSPVHTMYLDLSDLVALILIRIIPKERTHRGHHSHNFPDIESLLGQKTSHSMNAVCWLL